MAEPKYTGCCSLGEVIKISRHSANRFLLREQYEPKDSFIEVKDNLNLKGGPGAHDTVVEKIYSDVNKSELISYYWSEKHHKSIKGINLATFYYIDPNGQSMPINYRLYNPPENKTKNDYLREMIEEVISWGVKPSAITTDCWYVSKKNLRFFRNKKLNFQVGIAKNRQVKIEGEKYKKVEDLEIIAEGLIVNLKELRKVKVFERTENFQKRELSLLR